MERRLAAILAADVVGYSRLMQADEEATLLVLRQHQTGLLAPAIADRRGRIVKLMGDGVLAEFPSVIDAVQAALAIQSGAREWSARENAAPQLRYRVGVNLGDVMVEGDDIYGDGVNVASRLQQLAQPDEILISRPVRDQIRDKLDLRLDDLGDRSLKNMARPVRVFRIRRAPLTAALKDRPVTAPRLPRWWAAAAAALVFLIGAAVVLGQLFPQATAVAPASPDATRSAAAAKLSIVVLPFENASGDPEQDYFVEGITEDLITDLSRIVGAFVISRNTSFTYQGKPADPKQVATELGVRHVLTGSVRRQGESVRIGVQLVDGDTGAQLWADRFDRALRDLFSLQSEITGRLARSLQLELKEAASAKAMRGPPHDLDAQDYAMRAWAEIWNRPQNRATNDAGLALVAKALKLDPNNAEALATGSYAHTRAAQYNWSTSRSESLKRAIEMGEKAVELDSRNADAYYVLSFAVGANGDIARAHALIETCLTLNPNHAPAYAFYGWRRTLMGFPEETQTWIARAFALSPRDPLRAIWHQLSGQAYLLTGNYENAEAEAQRAVAANPTFAPPHLTLAAALYRQGRVEAAKAALSRHNEVRPVYRLGLLAAAFSPTISETFRARLEERYLEPLRRLGLPD
jgi:adenylate cyclase